MCSNKKILGIYTSYCASKIVYFFYFFGKSPLSTASRFGSGVRIVNFIVFIFDLFAESLYLLSRNL